MVGVSWRHGLHPIWPQSRCRPRRLCAWPPSANSGQDVDPARDHPRRPGAQRGISRDTRWQPELEWLDEEDRPCALRLSLCSHGRRSEMVHPLCDARGLHGGNPGWAQVFRVRDRAGEAYRSTRVLRGSVYRIASRGGVSKRSTDGDCKSSGSAFAGSNPASPISPSSRFSALEIRALSRSSWTVPHQPETAGDAAAAGLYRRWAAKR